MKRILKDCKDSLIDIKLREFCAHCKLVLCSDHETGYSNCDFCINSVAKELGMEYFDIAEHLKSNLILATNRK